MTTCPKCGAPAEVFQTASYSEPYGVCAGCCICWPIEPSDNEKTLYIAVTTAIRSNRRGLTRPVQAQAIERALRDLNFQARVNG